VPPPKKITPAASILILEKKRLVEEIRQAFFEPYSFSKISARPSSKEVLADMSFRLFIISYLASLIRDFLLLQMYTLTNVHTL
jgi:hypothetical protein